MRLAIPLALALVAAAAPRQGCGNGGQPKPYDPCAGKDCGASCTACAPGDPGCVETAVVKACDLEHRCSPRLDGMCDPARAGCLGRACGDECTIDPPCLSATPPCMQPSRLGRCDAGGSCNTVTPPPPDLCPPSWGCGGKACGDSCGYCPPDVDPARCPVPTFAATACDAQLQCVTAGTFTCPPDPCAGKKCGDACDRCGGLCMNPVATWCDGAGACVPGPVSCSP